MGCAATSTATLSATNTRVDPLDADLRERKYVYGPRGEKWGVVLTEIARRYPFPEVARGKYLPEGIVWLDMAKTYKSRAVNEIVRVYYIDESEPGVTIAIKRRLAAHAEGNWHYYIWLLNNDLEYFFRAPMPFLKAAVMLPVVCLDHRTWARRLASALCGVAAEALVVAALPASCADLRDGSPAEGRLMTQRLTIVMPLRGRPLFTLRFLWHANAARLPYKFILADGEVRPELSRLLDEFAPSCFRISMSTISAIRTTPISAATSPR